MGSKAPELFLGFCRQIVLSELTESELVIVKVYKHQLRFNNILKKKKSGLFRMNGMNSL